MLESHRKLVENVDFCSILELPKENQQTLEFSSLNKDSKWAIDTL